MSVRRSVRDRTGMSRASLVRIRANLDCSLPHHAQQHLHSGGPGALGTNVLTTGLVKRTKLATKRPSFLWPQVGADGR